MSRLIPFYRGVVLIDEVFSLRQHLLLRSVLISCLTGGGHIMMDPAQDIPLHPMVRTKDYKAIVFGEYVRPLN